MQIAGKVWKSKKSNVWLGEIPLLDLATQAPTKNKVPGMIKDAIEALVDDETFLIKVSLLKDVLIVEAQDQKKLMSLVLKRQQRKNKLTLEDVALQMHAKSINEYAQHEQGKHLPTEGLQQRYA
jgi:hypothetical protein